MGADDLQKTPASPASDAAGTAGGEVVADGEGDREGTLLLSVDDATAFEIVGSERRALQRGPFVIVSVPAGVEEEAVVGSEVVFAVIGDTRAPLTRGVKVERTHDGLYVVHLAPKVYGFLVPGLDEDEREALDQLLSTYADFNPQPVVQGLVVVAPHKATVVGKKVAGGITKGTALLSRGMKVAVGVVVKGIIQGETVLKGKLKPNQVQRQVSPATMKKLKAARVFTQSAVVVSGALVKGVVQISAACAEHLVQEYHKTDFAKTRGTGPKAEALKLVGSTAVISAVQIIDEVGEHVRVVMKQVASTTSNVVEHKYGEQAGEAARQGLGAATDVGEAALNMRRVGVKAVAKGTAKMTVAGVCDEEAFVAVQGSGQKLKQNVQMAQMGVQMLAATSALGTNASPPTSPPNPAALNAA